MLKLRCSKQLSSGIQIFQHFRICFFHKQTGKRCLLCQFTFAIYKLYKRKIVVSSYIGIIFTKGRCNMNNTGTICHGYIGIACYEKSFFILCIGTLFGAGIQWLIFSVFQCCSRKTVKDLISLYAFLFVS